VFAFLGDFQTLSSFLLGAFFGRGVAGRSFAFAAAAAARDANGWTRGRADEPSE
jgi:hypothetical protein